jgi:hypothetical protein
MALPNRLNSRDDSLSLPTMSLRLGGVAQMLQVLREQRYSASILGSGEASSAPTQSGGLRKHPAKPKVGDHPCSG